MRERWAQQEEAERKRQAGLRKLRESVAKEQCLQASARKASKFIIKEYERTHSKSLVEENIQKLRDTEQKKIDFINKRMQFVHDDERLKKLVRLMQLPQQSCKYSTSNTADFLSSIFECKSPECKKNKYLDELKEQINEKKLRELEYVRIQREQGHIWAQQDQQAVKEDAYKKLVRKKTMKSLREEYDKKIEQKKERIRNELQLSTSEAGMNKKLLQSSLVLLSPKEKSLNVLNN